MNNVDTNQLSAVLALHNQCVALKKLAEENMDRQSRWNTTYPTVAKTYNIILSKAKELLSLDEIILKTIEHIKPYDEGDHLGHGNFKMIADLLTELSILNSALVSFIQIHMPYKEKQGIGFEID